MRAGSIQVHGLLRRWLALTAADFGRVNRRMHNKMYVADSAMAVVGGRKVADEYYERDELHNFFDFDVFTLGAIVPQLQRLFDAYWNSRHVFPVDSIYLIPGEAGLQPRAAFGAGCCWRSWRR